MKKYLIVFLSVLLLISLVAYLAIGAPVTKPANAQSPSRCVTDPISFVPNKKLLPLYDEVDANNECLQKTGQAYCGRGKQPVGGFGPNNDCYAPIKIVMHTTHGAEQTADDVFAYFNNGSEGRRVGAHFGIGRDGSIIQMVELGGSQVEYAQTVGGYRTHISIEMASPGDYGSKADAPAAQYQAALQLVKTLMQKYNIPVTDLSCRLSGSCPSVSSHEDLAPGYASDPGQGWMTDFLADLPAAQPLPGTGTGTGTGSTGSSQVCITQVGDPEAAGVTAPGPLGCAGGGGGGSVNPGATCPGTGPVTCNPYLNDSPEGCHCTSGYLAMPLCANGGCPWCYPIGVSSSNFATDVSNPPFAPVYVPVISVGGQAHPVTCRGYGDGCPSDGTGATCTTQIWQILSCKDDVTGGAVWMQFHHSNVQMRTVIDKIYKSGDQIGVSDPYAGVGSHVHFQLGIGGHCGADPSGCVNSNEYIKCGG